MGNHKRAAASPNPPESTRTDDLSTLEREEPARKHARRDETVGPYTSVQRMGHSYSGGTASENAQVHYGDSYNTYYGVASTSISEGGQLDISSVLESLCFAQMDARRETISGPHANTCKWVFSREEYTNWRRSESMPAHHGFLWIKSKPGAGKSTLMKFMLRSAKRQLRDDKVISFFFNARGDILERSLEGFYRGLLYQLLTCIPRLQDVLINANVAGYMRHGWPLAGLKSLLIEAVLALGQERLTCFIDALDECPETEVRDMIEFFEDLGESTAEEHINMRVCFSSRHYPRVSIARCQHLMLDGQEGHQQDIEKYVQSKLKVRKSRTADDLKVAVQDKASGVFMWVVLVVRILNQESDHGKNNAALRSCLDRIPGRLHDLFQDILHRGMADNEALVPMLQWISFAKRPLTREELYFAVRHGQTDFDVARPWNFEEDDSEAMDLFILNASKGLAEPTGGAKPTIQFIHESVRDYLRESGFSALDSELGINIQGSTHEYLKRCCHKALSAGVIERISLPYPVPKAKSRDAKSLRTRSATLFPFLGYAVNNLFYHADLACFYGISQTGFIKDFSWYPWSTLNAVTAHYDIRRYPAPSDTLISVLLDKDCKRLVELKIQLQDHGQLSSEQFEHALRFALNSDNTKALVMLLEQQAAHGLLPFDRFTTLALACRLRSTTNFELLLRYHPSSATVSVQDCELLLSNAQLARSTELMHAVLRWIDLRLELKLPSSFIEDVSCEYDESEIQVLLKHANTFESFPDAALCNPAFTRHEDIVKVLIKDGAGTVHSFALISAAKRGDKLLVGNFLQAGADINARVGCSPTALGEACANNDLGMALLLLEHGADASLEPDWLDALLSEVCTVDKVDMVNVLLAQGADVNSKDRTLYSPLWQAASRGNASVVHLLLAANADVGRRGRDEDTPLVASLGTGREDIARMLLSAGADVNTANSSGDSPLCLACVSCSGNMVQELLTRGSKVTTRELSIACLRGNRAIVDELLAHDVDVNAKGRLSGCYHRCTPELRRMGELPYFSAYFLEDSATPLSVALWAHHEDIVHVLLEHGANIESVRARYRPLLRAMLGDRVATQSQTGVGEKLMVAASLHGFDRLLRRLFRDGANPNARGGKTYFEAIDGASRNGHLHVVKTLIANGENVRHQDASSYAHLIHELCIRYRLPDMVSLLLRQSSGFRSQAASVYADTLRDSKMRMLDDIVRVLQGKDLESPAGTTGNEWGTTDDDNRNTDCESEITDDDIVPINDGNAPTNEAHVDEVVQVINGNKARYVPPAAWIEMILSRGKHTSNSANSLTPSPPPHRPSEPYTPSPDPPPMSPAHCS